MQVENIVKFLQTAYSDEKLAALLAHASDGKLGYGSCCCLVGIPTSNHALQEAPGMFRLEDRGVDVSHYLSLERSTLMDSAETEFRNFKNDAERREILIPLILEEQARREKMRSEPFPVGDEQTEEVRA